MPDTDLLNEMGWEALANIRLRHLERMNDKISRLRCLMGVAAACAFMVGVFVGLVVLGR